MTEANAPERLGAIATILEDDCEPQKLELIWADSRYSGARVEIVKRTDSGFKVLPRRWVVERTFGWLGRYRRLSKDYQLLPEVSESMIYAAMVRLMLRRLTS